MGRARMWTGVMGAFLAFAAAHPGDPDPAPEITRLDPFAIQAQEPPKKGSPKLDPPGKGKEPPPKGKEPPEKKDAEIPDAFAQATNTGGEAPESSFSRMMGDWVGALYATQTIRVPSIKSITTYPTRNRVQRVQVLVPDGEPRFINVTTKVPLPPVTTVVESTEELTAQVPILSRGAFKVAENERPIPEDRVFLNFNTFQGVPGPNFQTPPPVTTLNGGVPTTTQSFIPSQGQDGYVNRGVIGFETTFLEGLASVGMRAPFVQRQGDGSLSDADFGALTFVFKYLAFTNGVDAISGGLVVTAPTGPAIQTIDGPINSTLIQPWVGFFASAGDLFAMGFSSIAVPTDDRDTTILFNDLSVGVVVYQSPTGFVNYVAPMAEAHLTTPVNNRGENALVSVPDLLVLTGGVQIGFGPASISLGVAAPVTEPRIYNYEAFAQLNFRY